MSRVQLALNVADLEEAIAFYSQLFGTPPAKVRPGYANFAVAEPPLKLVLIESPDREPGSLNHLGVEVETPGEVLAARDRLRDAGLPTRVEDRVACCYAVQDKVWVEGPGKTPWEFYVVLDDAEGAPDPSPDPRSSAAPCCSERPDLAVGAQTPTRC